jgi:hypothetical protein
MRSIQSPPPTSQSVRVDRLNASLSTSHDDPRVIAALEKYLTLCEQHAPPDCESFLANYSEIAAVLGPCLEGLALVQAAVPGISGDGAATAIRHPLPEGESGVRGGNDYGPLTEPLGDFRIIREIGRGGMGVVYEAEQRSL